MFVLFVLRYVLHHLLHFLLISQHLLGRGRGENWGAGRELGRRGENWGAGRELGSGERTGGRGENWGAGRELKIGSSAGSVQAKPKIAKPSYWSGKLLGLLSRVVSEKMLSALREEQGWTHSLQC